MVLSQNQSNDLGYHSRGCQLNQGYDFVIGMTPSSYLVHQIGQDYGIRFHKCCSVMKAKTISNSTYCPFYFSKVWSTTQHVGNSDDNPEGKPPQLSRWHAHQGTVVSVEYLSLEQGALLLTASEDCTARLWTLGGQYIGMFGQVSIALIIFWLPMLEDHSVFTASFLTSFVV